MAQEQACWPESDPQDPHAGENQLLQAVLWPSQADTHTHMLNKILKNPRSEWLPSIRSTPDWESPGKGRYSGFRAHEDLTILHRCGRSQRVCVSVNLQVLLASRNSLTLGWKERVLNSYTKEWLRNTVNNSCRVFFPSGGNQTTPGC